MQQPTTTPFCCVFIAFCVCGSVAPKAPAEVLGFSDATFNTDPRGGVVLSHTRLRSFSHSAGTVDTLAPAITALDGSYDIPRPDGGVTDPPDEQVMNFWAVESTEINGPSAALNLDVSVGVSNIRHIEVMFGVPVEGVEGQGNDLFIMEIGDGPTSNDGVVAIRPLDEDGQPIGDFFLSFDASDVMTDCGTGIRFVGDHGGTHAQRLVGVAFDLEDFRGTGTLQRIHGLRIDPDDKHLDVVTVGYNTKGVPDGFSVPEVPERSKPRFGTNPYGRQVTELLRKVREAADEGSAEATEATEYLCAYTDGSLGAWPAAADADTVLEQLGPNPYDSQVAEQLQKLRSEKADDRAAAAAALGFLRAYEAGDSLAACLLDPEAKVRREAATSLSWCGSGRHVSALLGALEDSDWFVRQSAHVALTNLTAMDFPYNALAQRQQRQQQFERWRQWWSEVSSHQSPEDVLALLDDKNLEVRLRAVRAVGALGGPGASEAILRVIAPYRDRDYRRVSPLEKHLVQAGLRSLGRLGQAEAFDDLLRFFGAVGWARYAADALGEFGDRRAIVPLAAAYASYAWGMKREVPPLYPPDDNSAVGMSPEDRMYETAYAISVALARLSLHTKNDTEAMRVIAPLLVANLPSDWDTGLLFEPEAFEPITAWLLARAGLRSAACDAAFRSADLMAENPETPITGEPREALTPEENMFEIAKRSWRDIPWCAGWFPALCTDSEYVERLLELLEHPNGWIRINAAKALMFINTREAINPIATQLRESKTEAEYGFSGVLEHDEFNDPTPRWREAFVRALGRLGAERHVPLLARILDDERNVLEVRYAAARALSELGTAEALAALRHANTSHPYHSIRLVAREALWRHGEEAQAAPPAVNNAAVGHQGQPSRTNLGSTRAKDELDLLVFIKGENRVHSDFNDQCGIDPFRQTYAVTNSGPAFRWGRNLYLLERTTDAETGEQQQRVTPLTHFQDGFVSGCEVSYDGERVIFSRRLDGDTRCSISVQAQENAHEDIEHQPLPDSDPWWHLWEVNVDGSGLRQLTFGPYHDVGPVYLPGGRIAFSSSRLGLRDEYHGYLCAGLSVMNPDGTDIRVIGFNLGGDYEPAVMPDGRLTYARLDLLYSRLKTELTLQATFPNGRGAVTLYGPERRGFWQQINQRYGERGWSEWAPRHRVLRMTQPQPFGEGRLVCATSGGLTIVGPGRLNERIVPHDKRLAVTTPYPLADGRILCAVTKKEFTNPRRHNRHAVTPDLGLSVLDPHSGEMTRLYNDPGTADFEARPVIARERPPVLAESPQSSEYTGRLACNSVFNTQHPRVQSRGRYVRIVEGMPMVSRHQTQRNHPGNRWRNHGGTQARVLATVPLAADGSFFAEVPADRFLQLQVLDSDRQVLGNQLVWMYVRPGETRSCIGCHEPPDTTPYPAGFPMAVKAPEAEALPSGGEFTYRAKAWRKGVLPDETEERNRTVRAVNLIGRQ